MIPKTTPNSRQKEPVKSPIPPTSTAPATSSEQPLPSAVSERPPAVVNSLAGAQGQKKIPSKQGAKERAMLLYQAVIMG